MNYLERAKQIAREAHQGQLDKCGKPYWGHVERVSNAGTTENECIVGVLHDIVEDTDWTFERLADEGFSTEVIEALRCVTKLSEEEPYDEFIERVAQNPLAVAVKLHDLRDNMDITRLEQLTDKDMARLKKYLAAYHRLTNASDRNH